MNVWNNMKSVMFIVPEAWLESSVHLQKILQDHFKEVAKLDVIVVANQKIKQEQRDENEPFVIFSQKDINLFGKLKNEKIKELVLNSYDTIFVCLTLNKKESKHLLKSQKGRVIGLNSGDFQGEINLSAKSNEPYEIVNFAKNTLLKITS